MQYLISPLTKGHPAAAAIEKLCGGSLEQVPISNQGPSGHCYWNADEFSATYGGTVEHGWLVMNHNDVLVEALHHAVVRMPDGSLLDVTAFPGKHAGSTAFIRDRRIVPPRDYPIFIKSKFVFVVQNAGSNLLVETAWRQNEINARIAQIAKEQGLAYNLGQHVAFKATPEFRSLMAELDHTKRLIDQARSLIYSSRASLDNAESRLDR